MDNLSPGEIQVLDEALSAFMRLQQKCIDNTTSPGGYYSRYNVAESLKTRFLAQKEQP